MSKKKSIPPKIMLAMCAWIGVMLSFLVLIGFAANAPIRISTCGAQVKTTKTFEENIDLLEQHAKALDDAVKENEIILARLGNACESRNKSVHKIVNISFKREVL